MLAGMVVKKINFSKVKLLKLFLKLHGKHFRGFSAALSHSQYVFEKTFSNSIPWLPVDQAT